MLAVAIWIGDRISEKGLGNGISMIIFVGIIARLPSTVQSYIEQASANSQAGNNALWWILPIILVAILALIVVVIFVELGERRIAIQYAKRVSGRKVYGGQSTYMPIKPNSCGVLPLIFSMSLLMFPSIIAGMFWSGGEEKGAFNNAKVWKRMIIIIAGAVMNILLGFVMMFAFTVQADSYSSTTISQFQPNAFTANTGLQTEDKIVEVNGYSIWNSRDLQFAISTLPYETVEGNTLEVYKERATSAACGVYNKYAKDESLSKDELQKYYNALSEGCSKINKAASKDEAKKLLDETCKSIYALDKSYDMSKYKTPEIDTTTSRPRFMGDVKVVRDGKEITLENVQFFTYYADENAEKENKPTVAFALQSARTTFTSPMNLGLDVVVSISGVLYFDISYDLSSA